MRRNVLILAILFGNLAAHASCVQGDSKQQAIQNRLIEIQAALTRFYQDIGRYPTDSEQLAALVENPHIEGWKGPYLASDRLMDPWQHPYYYGKVRDMIFVASAGSNGRPETTDVDLRQALSRGDDIIILMPDREP